MYVCIKLYKYIELSEVTPREMHRDHFLSSGVLLMITVIQQLRSHFNLNHDMSINNYLKAYRFSGLTLLNSGLYLSFCSVL